MTSDAEREANIALVRRIIDEVINRGNLSVADEGMVSELAPDFKQAVSTLRATFPDWHFAIEDALAVNDTVVNRATFTGTHTGTPYMGKPATGKAVTMSGIEIIRIAEGRVAEKSGAYDYLSLLQQLGIVPSDEEIVAANVLATHARP